MTEIHETLRMDGKPVALAVRKQVAAWVEELAAVGVQPRLDVIIVGDDPASRAYVASKEKAATKLGIDGRTHELPADCSQARLLETLASLQANPAVDGLLVQLPLPRGLDSVAVVEALDPMRDVDGLTPYNQGRLLAGRPHLLPCTPVGVMALLDHYRVPLRAQRAVVVGRSLLFGRPMAQLLLARDATVICCHSRTRDLPAEVAGADLLVVGVGQPGLIRGEWLKPGAVVVDVGINRLPDGRLVGDVDFEGAQGRAAAITPVPGGVGPMTIAMLLHNTVLAAAARAGTPLTQPPLGY